MTWETGTATDHVDLLNKIRDFLTTNATLVADGENWTQELGNTGVLTNNDAITLRGPGLGGTDNIYCGLDIVENPNGDTYNLRLWGHSGFDSDLDPRTQPLSSPDVYLLTWDQAMTYWIIANGRRWIIVIKTATTYSIGYSGFFLPYASPSEYPFPMMVAGMSRNNNRWSSTDSRDRFIASPGFKTLWVYFPDNVWRHISNYEADNGSVSFGTDADSQGYMFPTRSFDDYDSVVRADYEDSYVDFESPDIETITDRAGPCFDGSYLLRDLVIVSAAWTTNQGAYNSVMGVVEGVFWVPGRANSAENIINKDGTDYLVVQNLGRTGFRDYAAVRLV